MAAKQDSLIHCFKEWAIAVSALSQGKTILLLRKGGIREDSKQFKVKHDRIWLYPTYEHQKPQLLKPEYSDRVTEVPSGWHPTIVDIQSYAEITHILEVKSLETVNKLEPFYVWNRETIGDRLKWKPQQPLTVLLLKVSNLPTPVNIPYHQSYAGCRSWIGLQQPISLQGLTPVLDPDIYQQRVNEILAIVND